MLAPLHHRLEAGAQRERALAGAGAATEAEDAHVGVQQQVEGDPLLGAAAVQAERVAVAADQADGLVRADPAQAAAAGAEQHHAGVAGQLAGHDVLDPPLVVQGVHLLDGDVELGHPGPAGVDGDLGAVLLGVEADGRRLDPHREVLAHQGHVAALEGEVLGDGEDPAVVVAQAEAVGQREQVGVVELHVQRAAAVPDRHRRVQPPLADPQVVQQPQRLPGEVAELGVVALALELGDHDHGQHDVVLVEAQHRAGVGQQDRGVEDERLGRRGHGRSGVTGGRAGGCSG